MSHVVVVLLLLILLLLLPSYISGDKGAYLLRGGEEGGAVPSLVEALHREVTTAAREVMLLMIQMIQHFQKFHLA